MIWVLITTGLWVICIIFEKRGIRDRVLMFFICLLLLLIVGAIYIGQAEYKNMAADREKIAAVKINLLMIEGNLTQKELKEQERIYEQERDRWNRQLQGDKIMASSFVGKMFGWGYCIDRRILELEEIR